MNHHTSRHAQLNIYAIVRDKIDFIFYLWNSDYSQFISSPVIIFIMINTGPTDSDPSGAAGLYGVHGPAKTALPISGEKLV